MHLLDGTEHDQGTERKTDRLAGKRERDYYHIQFNRQIDRQTVIWTKQTDLQGSESSLPYPSNGQTDRQTDVWTKQTD